MKKLSNFTTCICLALLCFSLTALADDVTVVAQSEAAEGLDLAAVAELVRTTKNEAALEAAINDPEKGINNLDLDADGNVDFIRVLGKKSSKTHVIVLQAPLGENEFQDVASIEVEKQGEEVVLQVRGNEQLYGVNYYVVPPRVTLAEWAFVAWLFSPQHRVYHSTFHWGYYPAYWHPRPIVSVNLYRQHTVHYTKHVNYTVVHTTKVKKAKVLYPSPSSSVLVKRSMKNPTSTQKRFKSRQTTTVTKTKETKTKTEATRTAAGEAPAANGTKPATTAKGPKGKAPGNNDKANTPIAPATWHKKGAKANSANSQKHSRKSAGKPTKRPSKKLPEKKKDLPAA